MESHDDGSNMVAYFEVQRADLNEHDTQEGLIKIFGNSQFHLGRNATLCRRRWSDPTISNTHLRIHCILFEKDSTAGIPPFVYATDISSNGTYLKKGNGACASSQRQSNWGILMGRKNGSFLLHDGDELRISDLVTLIYHEMLHANGHRLTMTQEAETQLFASRYRITNRILGAGGYGKVLVAIKQKTQRQLACKVVNLSGFYQGVQPPNLRLPIADESQASMSSGTKKRWPSKVARCFREFDVLEDLDHPNIIAIEKVFWSPVSVYIFEELVTGGDLFSYMEYKGGRLTDVQAAVIVRQILKGIDYLHDQDVVHRDLKPDNILMTSLEDGARIVITDFGNARVLPDGHGGTFQSTTKKRMFSAVGTLEFVAPEVHKLNRAIPADKGYSKAVDMWSIGAVTTALISGDVIFSGRNLPGYDQEPYAIIMGLASGCDISIMDDTNDPDWSKVGAKPKEFIRRLLVLREEDRMTAREALAHPWFSDKCYAMEFNALYERSIEHWQPRRKIFRLIEPISGNSTSIKSAGQAQHTRSAFFLQQHHANPKYHMRNQHDISQGQRQDRPLSPANEDQEDTRFEEIECESLSDYKRTIASSDDKELSSGQPIVRLKCTYPNGESMSWHSLDVDPPASGMYPTHESMQNGYESGGSNMEAMKDVPRQHGTSQHEEYPANATGYHTRGAQSDSSIVQESPIQIDESIANPQQARFAGCHEADKWGSEEQYCLLEPALPPYHDMFGKRLDTTNHALEAYCTETSSKRRKFNTGL